MAVRARSATNGQFVQAARKKYTKVFATPVTCFILPAEGVRDFSGTPAYERISGDFLVPPRHAFSPENIEGFSAGDSMKGRAREGEENMADRAPSIDAYMAVISTVEMVELCVRVHYHRR